MRLLILDTRPIRRGAQIFADDLKRSLEKKGILLKRVFLYKEDKYETLILKENDIVLPFRDNHIFERFPSVQPALVRSLAREIKNFAPDIILCNGSRTLKYAAAIRYFFPSIKSKWVYRVIDSSRFWNPGGFKHAYYRRVIIPCLDAAVGVSAKSLKDMQANYRFNKPSVVIPRGIDPEKFKALPSRLIARQQLQLPENAFVVLFLGNLTRQKRPDRFLEVVAQLYAANNRVVGLLAGDGPLKSSLIEWVEDNKLGEVFHFCGYVQDVSTVLAASDVLLLTSDTEGLPGVVLEAAMAGLPSVAADVGGVQQCIIHGKTGFFCPPSDIEQFTQYVSTLMDNESLRAEMGNHARENVIANFSIESLTNKYLCFFEKLTNQQPTTKN
ncbi:MAG: glycosyltransferase family 4 protein [Bacteroidetes bacterium]|nr:glycosyltransferase family 4 protein [Bacteroidota bacterium]